jgi:Outer membrane protein beta-barrel domain
MRKFFVFALILITSASIAQKTDSTQKAATKKVKKDWSKVLLGNRPNDHFMIELGYDNWAGKPDTIRTKGFSRSFNFYFMFDFPFKTDPRLSVGAGLGIGSSNIYFDKEAVHPAAGTPSLPFTDLSASNYYKKSKLVSTYLDIPLELRYALDPENTNKSWKFAVGAKVGLLLSAYSKFKNQLNNAGTSINNSVFKESSKTYFNGTRLAATARVSKGVFGIYAQYQLTPFIKTAYGPAVYPFAIGIVISGL